ncbi:DNA polymerase [Faecalicoccus sp. LCP19S3_E3]|uniref:DNA polymerase n=1 Tax=unclassified Faecalicoccus TaxID=2643311 RepID=UPI003F916D53
MSRVLHIDLETYSDIDIGKCGAYRYVDSPNFEILLLAYAYDDEPVTVIDVAQREGWPTQVLDDILSSNIAKVAHNAAFERICLSKFLNTHLDPKAWHCTMVHALSLGFPASLADVGKALNLGEDKQKMAVGKRLITYFCKPCKPTQANGQRTRNYPYHDLEKWELFKEYNRQDVVTEQAIYDKLMKFPLPESEQRLYCLDQSINDYGIGVDTELMANVISYSKDYEASLRKECEELTGGINVHSIVQLKQWLTEQEGRQIDSLTKDDVDQLLKLDLKPSSKRILELRQETGKTSVKKYEAFERSICSDGRIHGAFQFYGAGRTGRWAGRLIQPQNFPRNAFEDIALARQMVKDRKWDEIEMLYGSMNDVFSTLIRTLIVPPQAMTFAIADYSAIEARVVAWMADEKWRQEVFASGGDIYCMSATQMFGVPVEKHGQNSHLRKKGKVAELACGYGGGVGALRKMGGEQMGLTEKEMDDIVKKWRRSSPHVVRLWRELGDAAIEAIDTRLRVKCRHGVSFKYAKGILFMQLPSGRSLAYVQPRFDGRELTYMGMNQTTRKWERTKTWGGKLTENLIQAIARDCLAVSMTKIQQSGYHIVMHVHDEVIVEVPSENAEGHLKRIEDLMGEPIEWAPGLLLTADGFNSPYYRKD